MINTVETALVLVDFQGRLAEIVYQSDQVERNVLMMTKGCQALGVPILPTVQVPEKLGPILPALGDVLKDMQPIPKETFSAMREPAFMTALHQTSRKQIILAGIEAHVCALQTGLDLIDAGYTVHVLSDGVFSRTKENQQLALQRFHDAGAMITSVEMALFEMVRTSRHPEFRTISRLVR